MTCGKSASSTSPSRPYVTGSEDQLLGRFLKFRQITLASSWSAHLTRKVTPGWSAPGRRRCGAGRKYGIKRLRASPPSHDPHVVRGKDQRRLLTRRRSDPAIRKCWASATRRRVQNRTPRGKACSKIFDAELLFKPAGNRTVPGQRAVMFHIIRCLRFEPARDTAQ